LKEHRRKVGWAFLGGALRDRGAAFNMPERPYCTEGAIKEKDTIAKVFEGSDVTVYMSKVI
jgi:hypothetical protein